VPSDDAAAGSPPVRLIPAPVRIRSPNRTSGTAPLQRGACWRLADRFYRFPPYPGWACTAHAGRCDRDRVLVDDAVVLETRRSWRGRTGGGGAGNGHHGFFVHNLASFVSPDPCRSVRRHGSLDLPAPVSVTRRCGRRRRRPVATRRAAPVAEQVSAGRAERTVRLPRRRRSAMSIVSAMMRSRLVWTRTTRTNRSISRSWMAIRSSETERRSFRPIWRGRLATVGTGFRSRNWANILPFAPSVRVRRAVDGWICRALRLDQPPCWTTRRRTS